MAGDVAFASPLPVRVLQLGPGDAPAGNPSDTRCVRRPMTLDGHFIEIDSCRLFVALVASVFAPRTPPILCWFPSTERLLGGCFRSLAV